MTAIDWIGTLNTFTYSEESSIFWMSLRFSLGKNFALLDTREITHRVIQAQTGSSLCCQYDEIVLMNRDILYSIISEFFLLHVCNIVVHINYPATRGKAGIYNPTNFVSTIYCYSYLAENMT